MENQPSSHMSVQQSVEENKKTPFEEIFGSLPTGSTTTRHWESARIVDLESAALKIKERGANPWVFSADPRQFWQFAKKVDYDTLNSFTRDEHNALLGEWSDEDWDPATFGYSHPQE